MFKKIFFHYKKEKLKMWVNKLLTNMETIK